MARGPEIFYLAIAFSTHISDYNFWRGILPADHRPSSLPSIISHEHPTSLSLKT
jgi:hypothetical protein